MESSLHWFLSPFDMTLRNFDRPHRTLTVDHQWVFLKCGYNFLSGLFIHLRHLLGTNKEAVKQQIFLISIFGLIPSIKIVVTGNLLCG